MAAYLLSGAGKQAACTRSELSGTFVDAPISEAVDWDRFELTAREEGQTMAEYGTVLGVITLACLTAFVLLATSATSAYTRVASLFS